MVVEATRHQQYKCVCPEALCRAGPGLFSVAFLQLCPSLLHLRLVPHGWSDWHTVGERAAHKHVTASDAVPQLSLLHTRAPRNQHTALCCLIVSVTDDLDHCSDVKSAVCRPRDSWYSKLALLTELSGIK